MVRLASSVPVRIVFPAKLDHPLFVGIVAATVSPPKVKLGLAAGSHVKRLVVCQEGSLQRTKHCTQLGQLHPSELRCHKHLLRHTRDAVGVLQIHIQTAQRCSHDVGERLIEEVSEVKCATNVVACTCSKAEISRPRIYTQHVGMTTEHFATFKFGANASGLMEAVADISPPLENVLAIQFIGWKLRATTAPQEIKITCAANAGWTPDGYYAVVGNLSDPALAQVPPGPNNNGILITPLALVGGATDQDDNGFYSNQPQTVLTNCKGAITRLQFYVSDFSGQGTLSQWDGHLYLKFKFIRVAKPDFYSPAKRTRWQEHLRDAYVERGDGF